MTDGNELKAENARAAIAILTAAQTGGATEAMKMYVPDGNREQLVRLLAGFVTVASVLIQRVSEATGSSPEQVLQGTAAELA